MARLFVTGVSGFLGGAFGRHARAAGHQVIGLARRETDQLHASVDGLVVKDVRDLSADDLPRGLDAAVNFATATTGRDEEFLSSAVDGVRRTLEASQVARVPHFVHISSMSVYPAHFTPVAKRPSLAELEPCPEKRGIYARAKTLAERAVIEWAGCRDIPFALTVVRPGLVFGEQMLNPLAGTALELPFGLAVGLGRSTQGVPLLHVDDLADGLLGLVESSPPAGQQAAFDVLSGPPPSKRELLAIYRKLSGQAAVSIWIPWLVAGAASRLIDVITGLAGRPRSTHHAVRRLYSFEPFDLPWGEFWKAANRQPQHGPDSALRTALTMRRTDLDPDRAGAQQRQATADLRALVEVAGEAEPPPFQPGETIVVVGAGRVVTEFHLPALHGLNGPRVTAVVDRDIRAAQTVAQQLDGARPYRSLDEIDGRTLAEAAVVVATPGHTHREIVVEALQRGQSVIAEKPLALTSEELAAIEAAEAEQGKRLSVVHNYRLRANVVRFWRYLLEHDLGALLRARVDFHSGRLVNETSRWSQEEKRFRVLPLEIGIHFVDIACLLAGEARSFHIIEVSNDCYTGSTTTIHTLARTSGGASLELNLSVTGTARRVIVEFEFERAVAQLTFFPEGFRILPRRRTPLDDAGAACAEFASFFGQIVRQRASGGRSRSTPHLLIYRNHFSPQMEGQTDPFSISAIKHTMTTLHALCDHVYPPR